MYLGLAPYTLGFSHGGQDLSPLGPDGEKGKGFFLGLSRHSLNVWAQLPELGGRHFLPHLCMFWSSFEFLTVASSDSS